MKRWRKPTAKSGELLVKYGKDEGGESKTGRTRRSMLTCAGLTISSSRCRKMTDAHLQIDWIDWMCGERWLNDGLP